MTAAPNLAPPRPARDVHQSPTRAERALGIVGAHPLAVTMAVVGCLAAAVWFVVYWSVLHPPLVVPSQAPVVGADGLPAVFRGWTHWDATWYSTISHNGYDYRPGVQSSVAFFPMYPLAIRGILAFAPPGTSEYIAGSLLTLASGGAAAVLLWVWCRKVFDAATATTAVFLLALYPYSIYLYGPIYADALFLAGVLGAFVLLENDHVGAAALVGALTTATRPEGAIVAVVLIARLIERRHNDHDQNGHPRRRILRGMDPRLIHRRDTVIAGAGLGFLAYCTYLKVRFGDPVAFASVQGAPGWDQAQGPTTWLKASFFAEVAREPLSPASLGLLLQASLAVAALATVPWIYRRLGWSYALFVTLIVAMPLIASKDFQGAGRYLLPAFPVIAVAAHALNTRPVLRAAILVTSVPILLLFASWFAKGNYLA